MQRNDNISNLDDREDERILMASINSASSANMWEEKPEPRSCAQTAQNLGRFVGINLTGWGLEYMVCDAGIILVNPQLFQNMMQVATNYYVSPMALIGRGLIWAERGVLAIAYDQERPENIKEIAKTAACDLAALGLIGLAYWAGSDLNKHSQSLIEITFIDSFVISSASLVIRSGAGKIAECYAGIKWKFWQKRKTPHPIILDERVPSDDRQSKESPPSPVFSLNHPFRSAARENSSNSEANNSYGLMRP